LNVVLKHQQTINQSYLLCLFEMAIYGPILHPYPLQYELLDPAILFIGPPGPQSKLEYVTHTI
jgi:hypothetical protein